MPSHDHQLRHSKRFATASTSASVSGHVRCTGKLPNRLKRQIIIHATLVSVGLVQQDAQFVLFPFASIMAYSISLAGRRL